MTKSMFKFYSNHDLNLEPPLKPMQNSKQREFVWGYQTMTNSTSSNLFHGCVYKFKYSKIALFLN